MQMFYSSTKIKISLEELNLDVDDLALALKLIVESKDMK